MRPSASTSSSPATWAAMPPTSRPVPCVPVWVAPATVCTWMSPMLASDSPRASNSALSTCRGQPASTVTVPAARSTDLIAVIWSGRSRTPSAIAVGVNEWPLPVIRIVWPSSAACATSAATSATEPGAAMRRGLTVTLPAQLRHPPAAAPRGLRIDPLCSFSIRRRTQPPQPHEADHDGDQPAASGEPIAPAWPQVIDDSSAH